MCSTDLRWTGCRYENDAITDRAAFQGSRHLEGVVSKVTTLPL